MIAALLLDSPGIAPAEEVLRAVRGAALSEGIFDLDALLARFPAYRDWFVAPAFPPGALAPFAATAHPLRPASEGTRWLLLHSAGDTLIDAAQGEGMYAHLCAIAPGRVDRDFASLTREHDEILRGDEVYVELVADFVAKCTE
ncbi:hypothetical protein HWV62_28654 [Athelia sp. TMB]|nr:hypothetical protein HWV62_28654 [Athelia sp. TMB]